MKRITALMAVLLLVVFATQSMAQYSRKPQIEVFGGIGIPLGPEEFKDYFKMGLSLHGQYVMFPSPNLGISFGAAFESFSFDGDKFLEDLDAEGYGIEVEGSANLIELGIGVRPYLTPVEASTQFFLFAMGTYNLLSSEIKVSLDEYSESFEDDDSKPGVAVGAGLEMPATESMNLILQGLVRFIFTEEETTSFIGITAGLVF